MVETDKGEGGASGEDWRVQGGNSRSLHYGRGDTSIETPTSDSETIDPTAALY